MQDIWERNPVAPYDLSDPCADAIPGAIVEGDRGETVTYWGRSMTSNHARKDTDANGRSPSYGRDPLGSGPSERPWTLRLEKPERALLDSAKEGKCLEFPFDVEPSDGHTQSVFESMPVWGPDRTIRAKVLRHLLVASDWAVHIKGVRIRGARITGQLDLESATLRCPLVLEDCYLENGVALNCATASSIELARCWINGFTAKLLIVTEELDLHGSKLTDMAQLDGAKIAGELKFSGAEITPANKDEAALIAEGIKVGGDVFLDEHFSALGAVTLKGARIKGELKTGGAKITPANAEGDSLIADEATVGGGVTLNGEFAGAIQLRSASITGDLNCSGARITRFDTEHNALIADEVTVGGGVLLNDGFKALGAVRLHGASIIGELKCSGAVIGPNSDRNAFIADRVTVGGDVLFDKSKKTPNEFTASGAVRLLGANISGQLNCRGAQITGADEDGDALIAHRITVGGRMLLDRGFTANGAVQLVGAAIAGELKGTGAKITCANNDGKALDFDRAKVGGDVLLDEGFTACGAVRMRGASISGKLNCSGAKITPTTNAPDALIADGVTVGGRVLLEGLTAAGPVRLRGATITGELRCSGAQISRADKDGNALIADRIKVTGGVLLEKGFEAAGTVRFSGAQLNGRLSLDGAKLAGDKEAFVADGATIGQQLIWAPKAAVTGKVSLERTHLHRLDDDWHQQNAFWPDEGNLALAGFEYDEFGGNNKATWQDRLKWIRGQQRERTRTQPGTFEAQPYERLVRVYREAGQDSEAREIAIARRRDLRKYGDLGWWRRRGNWLLDVTVGHGYKPLRAVGILAVVYALAFGVFFMAQHKDMMVPAIPTSTNPAPTAMECVRTYPCFYPAGYAFDVTIPIISSGQAVSWRPNTAADWGWTYVVASWIFTGSGWALAALVGVGYTGLIRRD